MFGLFNSTNPGKIKHPKRHGDATKQVERERWILLVDAIEALATSQSISQTVGIVLEAARSLAASDGVTFVMRDGEYCHYVEENAINPLWKGRRFPLINCVSGWAMLNRQSAIIPDIYQDERVPHDAYRPTFVKSMMMIPVGMENPIAAIGVYWAKENVPDPDTAMLIEALARSTAIALQNAYLQARVEESGDRMKMTLDAAGLGAWEIDTVTGEFITSARFKEQFGLDPEAELTFDEMMNHVHPEERNTLGKLFQRARQTGNALQMEFRVSWPVDPLSQQGLSKEQSEQTRYHWLEFRGGASHDVIMPPRRISGVSISDDRTVGKKE